MELFVDLNVASAADFNVAYAYTAINFTQLVALAKLKFEFDLDSNSTTNVTLQSIANLEAANVH